MVTGHCHACVTEEKSPWWQDKLFWVLMVYLLIFGTPSILPAIVPLRQLLLSYLQIIVWPVILGLFLGGIIEWLIPREYISFLLAAPKKRTIIYAVSVGFLMSACSHGILALAIQLYKKGASTAAVVAFLLASPWANLPVSILMFGFFGYKALLIIFSAVVIALVTGYIYIFLEKRKLVESNPNTVQVPGNFSILKDARQRLASSHFSIGKMIKGVWSGTVSLADMVLWWILLGMLLASLVAAYIPTHIIHQYMGPSLLGLLVTLCLATIIEVCSEGSAPLAFELYRQTGALGNSFTFLMAGVVTDYTEIGLLWTNIGWRCAVWLPIIAVPQVLLLSWLFNLL
jgi:uncharacterized membrane protein YraQ (UPF0718 family)